jgi:hypothetical protein
VSKRDIQYFGNIYERFKKEVEVWDWEMLKEKVEGSEFEDEEGRKYMCLGEEEAIYPSYDKHRDPGLTSVEQECESIVEAFAAEHKMFVFVEDSHLYLGKFKEEK